MSDPLLESDRIADNFLLSTCGVPVVNEPPVIPPADVRSASISAISFLIHGNTPIMILRAKIFPFLLSALFACILVWYLICKQFPIEDDDLEVTTESKPRFPVHVTFGEETATCVS
jgi:hypothetical protein